MAHDSIHFSVMYACCKRQPLRLAKLAQSCSLSAQMYSVHGKTNKLTSWLNDDSLLFRVFPQRRREPH